MPTAERPVPAVTADDLAGLDYARELNDPGQFPYTRGIHESGYLGKLWTMRQFAGFGTPEATNRRYRDLLDARWSRVERGIRPADPDGERTRITRSRKERWGSAAVSVASLADMMRLFEEIPLDRVTTSMTINSPAAMIFAMYLVAAERQGVRVGEAVGGRSRTTS